MKRENIVIGGGIAGLCTAYYLFKNNKQVTVIDKGTLEDKTSYGNAGILSGFDKEPLSHPGIFLESIKLLLSGKSPLHFGKNIDLKLFFWLYKFLSFANKGRLKKTLILFRKYAKESLDAYSKMDLEDLIKFEYSQEGILLTFTEEKDYLKKFNTLKDNPNVRLLSKEEEKKLAPILNDKPLGSFLLKRNAKLNPEKLLKELKKYLLKNGVEFIEDEILELKVKNNEVKELVSTKATYRAKNFIGATGINLNLAKQLGTKLLILPAKGYSITFKIDEELKPKIPLVFANRFIMLSPRKKDIRITAKLELASNSKLISQKRIDSILNNLKEYTKAFNIKDAKFWTGFRPLSPNDMPLIGRDENAKNFIHLTGLGWLGMTFAPALARIVTDLILKEEDNEDNLDLLLFSGFYQG